jgi:hypothetical protein
MQSNLKAKHLIAGAESHCLKDESLLPVWCGAGEELAGALEHAMPQIIEGLGINLPSLRDTIVLHRGEAHATALRAR